MSSRDPGDVFFNSPLPGPALAGLAWGLGCAAQLQQPALWPAQAYAAWLVLALGLAFALVARAVRPWPMRCGPRPLPLTASALVLACIALMGAASTGLRAADRLADALPPALEGVDLRVEGRVAGLPQATSTGLRFEFEVDVLRTGDGRDLPAAGLAGPAPRRVLLSWFGRRAGPVDEAAAPGRTTEVLVHGDRWRMLVRLKAPHGLANPGGHDAELHAWSKGIQAHGHVLGGPRHPPPQRLEPGARWTLGALRQRVRDAILSRVGDRAAAGTLAALVTGDQSAILPADWRLYRDTGVAHLVAISGLHVTAFAWLAAAAVGVAWRRMPRACEAWPAPSAGLVAGVALAALYAAFSGGGVPAQRTVGMLALVALLRLRGRCWPWPSAWVVVGAVVTAWDPWSLLQPGFWLSFVAVGVLMAAGGSPARVEAEGPPAADAAAGTAPASPSVAGPPRWRVAARRMLHEQWLMTVALAPLALWLFGQLSVVGLGANLLAIPWVTGLVLPLALAGVAWPPLWDLAALAVQGLGACLSWLVAMPGAVLTLPAAPPALAAAGLAGGVLLVLRLPAWLRCAGLPLLLPVLLWQPMRPAPGHFELLAADVGQGQAVLVRTAGHDLLYDAGPRWSEESDAGAQVLVPLLRAQGADLDLLVISHADADHAGGAAAVLMDQPRAALLASLPAGHPLAAWRPPQVCLAGQRWTWDGVRFEVLHPFEDAIDLGPGQRPSTPNALSCVLRVVAADGAAALLAGDLEAPGERRLLRTLATSRLRADLLLVPHHGSRTSSTEAFIDAVQPRLALVQAGYRNRYGHPAADVMARYAARGIPVAATAGCGAARWASAAPAHLGCQRPQARRYWQHRLPAWVVTGAQAAGADAADGGEEGDDPP